MKIVVYLDEFLPPSQTFVKNQIDELMLQGHNVIIVAQRQTLHTQYQVLPIFNNFSYPYRIKKYLNKYGRFILPAYLMSNKLRSVINLINPDVIICQFANNAIDLYIARINCPVFIFLQGFDASKLPYQYSKYRKILYKISITKNFRLLFVSTYLQKICENLIPGIKGEVFYFGIPTGMIQMSYKDPESREITILQISRLVEKKGIVLTLKTLYELKKILPPEIIIKTIILGDGPMKKSLENLISSLEINNIVTLKGHVSYHATLSILRDSDIYIQPSIVSEDGDSEGLSNSVLEALTANKYVITTKYTGIQEIIDLKKFPVSICQPNSNNLAKMLYDVIINKKYILKNSDQRQFMVDNFDISIRVKKLIELIQLHPND